MASVGVTGQAGGASATGGASVAYDDAANTNVHVAGLVLASLAVIVLFHLGGFRFAVDAGVTSR